MVRFSLPTDQRTWSHAAWHAPKQSHMAPYHMYLYYIRVRLRQQRSFPLSSGWELRSPHIYYTLHSYGWMRNVHVVIAERRQQYQQPLNDNDGDDDCCYTRVQAHIL